MPRLKVYDVSGGDTINYDIVDESNGYRQPTFMRTEDERFEDFFNIKDLKCRENDILLNSYPKTGTHWMWEIVALMLKKTAVVTGTSKIKEMIESVPTSVMNEVPSPRILNSHLKIQYLPQDIFTKKAKQILVCRNPKDVVVSFYHHTRGITVYKYEGKFENFLKMYMRGEVDYGSYPEYLLEWQAYIREHPDQPILVIYYEDLREDLRSQLLKLRKFLELDISDSLLDEMCYNLTFSQMKIGKETAMTQEDRDFLKPISKPGFSFLRKGQVGDWKNFFTVAQNEEFDAWWAKETVGLEMFKFRYD